MFWISSSGWSIVQADATDVKSHSIPGKTKVTSSKKNSNHACIAAGL